MDLHVLLNQIPWQIPLQHAPLFGLLFLASSFAMLGAMLTCGVKLAKLRKRTSYEKSARQLASLASFASIIFVGTSAVLIYFAIGHIEPVNFADLLYELPWVLLASTTLLLLLTRLGWKAIVKHQLFISALGGLCFIQGALGLVAALFAAHCLIHSFLNFGDVYVAAQNVFTSPPGSTTFWLLMLFLPQFLAMPAVFGQLGLLLLRPFQDFGRDHYTIAFRFCMAWIRRLGLICLVLSIAQAAYLGYTLMRKGAILETYVTTLIPQAIMIFLWGLSCLIFILIENSKLPLRYTGWMSLASLLALITTALWLAFWLA